MAKTDNLPRGERVILSIAGSDPSGGAGIQADLKTFAILEVYGAAAITCLTEQNTTGVYASNPVPAEVVKAQVKRVLDDLPVSHVKLGMLGNRAIVREVGGILADFSGEVICDPILRASSGATLLEEQALGDFKNRILSRATALTPNLPEFQLLTGLVSDGDEEIYSAAEGLFADHPRLSAIVLKGGHRREEEGEVVDTLFLREGDRILTNESRRTRINTGNTHGTGCTFAAALAVHHLKCGDWRESFDFACAFLDQLIRASAGVRLGHGTGPLLHHLFRA